LDFAQTGEKAVSNTISEQERIREETSLTHDVSDEALEAAAAAEPAGNKMTFYYCTYFEFICRAL
jgi:hypothetical protein